jgi:ABC-type sugar transport system ATPase subunit
LKISDGEIVVLLGPSGCGKTTTLRLIAGLETPTSGKILIENRDVAGVPPRDRKLSFVFQRPAIYPHLDVCRNLAFGIQMRETRGAKPTRSIAERVHRIARLLGLDGVMHRRPFELSGGQQQRVALGRALAAEPDVLLLDEPLTQLDGQLRAELRHELHLLQRRLRTTMIYVTHDQTEALALADRLVVIDDGVIQQEGTPQSIYEKPRNRFVAGFLGWPAMNFWDGRVDREGGRVCFRAGKMCLPLPPNAEALVSGRDSLTLGLRPENVRLAPAGETVEARSMQVELAELMGHEWLVTLSAEEQTVIARLPASTTVQSGETLLMVMDLAAAHWFDTMSGLALQNGQVLC